MEIFNRTNEAVTLRLHLENGSSGTLQSPAHPEKVRVPNLPCDVRSVEWWYKNKGSTEKRRAPIERDEDGTVRVVLKSEQQEDTQKNAQPTLLSDPELSKQGPESLQDPRLISLVDRLETSEEKFVDGHFPNEKLRGLENISQYNIEFHRPDVMMKRPVCFPKTCPKDTDLIQGALGDCWIIATLAIMYSHDVGLIRKMIVMRRPDLGLYVVRFIKFGKPIFVIVDDRLPFTDSGHLSFASHFDKQTLWGPIVEKAYAKLLGGYHQLVGGKISDALMDFTGHASKSINMSRNRLQKVESLELVWRLHKKNGLTELLGCSVRGTQQRDGMIEEKLSNGLYAGHAYAILDFREVQVRLQKDKKKERVILVELMNPWGKNEWNGRFGKSSNLWSLNPDLGTELAYGSSRGTFWMEMKDFTSVFDRIEGLLYYVDQLRHTQTIRSKLTMKSVSGCWSVKSAGGAQGALWQKNPQYHISFKRKMGVDSMLSVYLIQQDTNWNLGRGIVTRKSLQNVGVR